MKVSVIIPLFNQKAFVQSAIDSALDQPETGEVIVVDDGSSDGGGEFVRALARTRDRLHVMNHPGNVGKGVGASRNLAMRSARFPYLAFLDADDFMLPGRFVHTQRLFALNPGVGAVAEALGLHDKEGKVTMLRKVPAPGEMFFEMEPFGKSGHFSVCALTVRKEALDRAGYFDETLRIGEDTHWLARLVLTTEVVCGDLNRAVALRRLHEGNVSHDFGLARKQKPLMAMKLIAWNSQNLKNPRVRDNLVKLFLKYHYEANHIHGNGSRISRKSRDLKALTDLLKTDVKSWHSPVFRYFAKTVFHLPVEEHIDYYR